MAAALQIPHHPPPSEQPGEDSDPLLHLKPGTLRTWRTVKGVVIGVTGELTSGEWIAMLPDESMSAHPSREDASLHLTLAYMRGLR